MHVLHQVRLSYLITQLNCELCNVLSVLNWVEFGGSGGLRQPGCGNVEGRFLSRIEGLWLCCCCSQQPARSNARRIGFQLLAVGCYYITLHAPLNQEW
jgi:hypothetical protein